MGEAGTGGKLLEGLRQLPWVQAHRRKTDDQCYLDCRSCKRSTPELIRARWRCGWLPESRWAEWPKNSDGIERAQCPTVHVAKAGPEPRQCPGYVVRLPIVGEAARANLWREKGSLRDLYDVPLTDLLRDAVDILEAEKHAVMDAMSKEAANGSG